MTLDKALMIIERDIKKHLKEKERCVIAIDGMSAAGKTTLAKAISERLDGQIIHMDDFFLQDHQRTDQRLKQVGGNIDYRRFFQEIIASYDDLEQIVYHAYDCRDKRLRKKILDKDKAVLIIEGAYALRQDFYDFYDLRYLCIINPLKQVQRLKARSPQLLKRFLDEWIPMENTFIDHRQLKDKVDHIFTID